MSRKKKFTYRPGMTEDEIKKALYRDVWYRLSSDIRRARRPAGLIKCATSFDPSFSVVEEAGSFTGTILNSW